MVHDENVRRVQELRRSGASGAKRVHYVGKGMKRYYAARADLAASHGDWKLEAEFRDKAEQLPTIGEAQ